MSEAWDLRSNIKAKPGSQGTLFQPGDKSVLNPQRRWPKGYGPERLNEVREGMKLAPVSSPRWTDEEFYRPEVKDAVYAARPRIEDAIARSTVPASHLKGISFSGNPEPGDLGTYWTGRREVNVDMTGVRSDTHDNEEEVRRGRQDREQTLIHEIGHHFHNMHPGHVQASINEVAPGHAERQLEKDRAERPLVDIQPNETRQFMARSAVESGVSEAHADNYMEQHYRTGGRKSKPVSEGRYEVNFTPEERHEDFPGYNEVRKPKNNNLGPQFAQTEQLPGMIRFHNEQMMKQQRERG